MRPIIHWASRYSQSQLERIVRHCADQRIWLILDAVYLDIVAPESIALPHHIHGADDILITVGSLSKSHRMTGWRIGWAVGPAPLSAHLANLSVCMHYGLAPFIMDAATVAIEQSSQTPLVVRSVMQTRRQLALNGLKDIDPVRLIDPGQGMFVLLDVEPLKVLAYDFAMGLLESELVSVLPCDGFGPGGQYLVRNRLMCRWRSVERCLPTNCPLYQSQRQKYPAVTAPGVRQQRRPNHAAGWTTIN